MSSKIIVLTPVKNEAWILDRFLSVTSKFADSIIIADQNSSDGSQTICARYPKVHVIKNEDGEYNEASRQTLLINAARSLFPNEKRILLAIDADEILAADAMQSQDWRKMVSASPGTILFFEKPTFIENTSVVIRYDGGGWPLGYVDDGVQHKPTLIHSTRVPTPDYANKLVLNEIKFLHYALVRLDAQASKQRMYSMLENLRGTKSLRLRRRIYNSKLDFSREGSRHESSNKSWFDGWEVLGIDMHKIPKSEYYWYDYEALRLFYLHGTKRFLFDDIWNFDWERFRLKAISEGYQFAIDERIYAPRPLLRILYGDYVIKVFDEFAMTLKKLQNKVKAVKKFIPF